MKAFGIIGSLLLIGAGIYLFVTLGLDRYSSMDLAIGAMQRAQSGFGDVANQSDEVKIAARAGSAVLIGGGLVGLFFVLRRPAKAV